MKIRFARGVKTALGAEVVLDDKTKATLANVVCIALGRFSQKDLKEGIPPGESYRRGKLAERIKAAKSEVELTAEDVALIKRAVEAYWSPEIVGPVWDMLEGRG